MLLWNVTHISGMGSSKWGLLLGSGRSPVVWAWKGWVCVDSSLRIGEVYPHARTRVNIFLIVTWALWMNYRWNELFKWEQLKILPRIFPYASAAKLFPTMLGIVWIIPFLRRIIPDQLSFTLSVWCTVSILVFRTDQWRTWRTFKTFCCVKMFHIVRSKFLSSVKIY